MWNFGKVASEFAAFGMVAALLAATGPAHAEKRVALVIGNGAYQHAPQLPNPKNDAHDVAAALKRTGFDTIVGFDLDKAGMDELAIRFARAAREADVALFYYSGHAMQFSGINYLMPVDAILRDEADLRRMARLDDIVADLQRARNLKILVLDSCRDNPLVEELKRSIGRTRGLSIRRGLAKIESPRGTIVSYATQAGSTADDGNGRNSPYTTAFLKHIEEPAEIGDIFRRISVDVYEQTKRSQLPELSLSLIGKFYLKGRPSLAPIASDRAAQAWAVTQNSSSIAVLQVFIKQFGGTVYGKMARARLEELKKNKVAVVAPPIAPAQPLGPCGTRAVTVSLSRTAKPLTAAEECGLKPKDTFKECADCPAMVMVPAGSFMMGSPESEKERDKDEGPQHRVTIAKAFAVGKHEVTFSEWDACVADGGCNGYRPKDEDWGRGMRPVINVSWVDAKSYLAWLSRKTGKTYHLLSEAEWEYAARAGTTTPFSTGQTITTDQANFYGKSTYNGSSKGQFRRSTVAVGTFAANAFGLDDMHGNVWEWTENCYDDSYVGAPTDGSATTADRCEYRVLRGGSWSTNPSDLRAADRIKHVPSYRNLTLGFRVARTSTPSSALTNATQSHDVNTKKFVAIAPPVTPAQRAGPCGSGAVTVSLSRAAKPLTAAEECALRPKSGFKECAECPEMVVVRAGSFTMGSPIDEKGRDKDEGPQHLVTIAKPFAVGKFAVTFDEWDACVANGGCNGYRPTDSGWGRGLQPVINVNWEDANAYVKWLSRKTGKVYRLLSEAEWEFVARAKSRTPFWWGATISSQQANFNATFVYASGSEGYFRQSTVPVDNFLPNPWGLFQVHGNVWEWVQDCWHENFNGALLDGSAWMSGDCSSAVLRGGSWSSVPAKLRASSRYYRSRISARSNKIGLRVARTIVTP